jgi:multicomponent K+:H+ antiporter subunit D
VADQVVARRRREGDRLRAAARFPQTGLMAGLFFAAAIGMAGMPPMSGFLGKLLVLDAAKVSSAMPLIWTVILATSLICIIGFARAGSTVFWKSAQVGEDRTEDGAAALDLRGWVPIGAVGFMLAGMVLLSAFAGPITGYLEGTAAQLYNPIEYILAVLGPDALAGR